MTSLNVHNVISKTTITQDFDTFTCETITIKTRDGQKITLELFTDKPEPVNETELLMTAIKGSLVHWGLEDFPEYHKLVSELYHEATKPDRVEPLDFSSTCFMGCFSWKTADAPLRFWCDVYDWSVK